MYNVLCRKILKKNGHVIIAVHGSITYNSDYTIIKILPPVYIVYFPRVFVVTYNHE